VFRDEIKAVFGHQVVQDEPEGEILTVPEGQDEQDEEEEFDGDSEDSEDTDKSDEDYGLADDDLEYITLEDELGYAPL
jgi:hypothetical protein